MSRGSEQPGGSFIPAAWRERVLKDLMEAHLESTQWMMDWLAEQPRPPWHRRQWNLLKWRVARGREWTALKIAPWLERDTY